MAGFSSDALVLFGATGDLAYRKIFPAVQALIQRQNLAVPVIAVGKASWGIERLRERIGASLSDFGNAADTHSRQALLDSVRFVEGDYRDPDTFAHLATALGGAACPLHYLAIPPSLFPTVIERLPSNGGSMDSRVVVEKPFGRDLASARALNAV